MTVKTSLGFQAAHYEPPRKILLDEERTVTDGKYRIVFCIIATIWLASCICALYCSDREKFDHQVANETIPKNVTHNGSTAEKPKSYSTLAWIKDMVFFYVENYFDFNTHYAERGSLFMWASIALYSAMILLAMRMMHNWAIMSPPALIVMSSTVMVTSIVYHFVLYFFNQNPRLEPYYYTFLYWITPEAVLLVMSILVFLNIMRYTGVSLMGDLLKKTCRFYATCRYLIVIGFLISSLIILLNAFTAKVLENFIVNDIGSKIVYSVVYAGSCYMILLTHISGRMVISATVASYYWNQNDEQSPLRVMCRKVVAVVKYQFGSACYKAACTSTWFIPLIAGLFGYTFEFYETAAGYCLIFDMLMIVVFDYEVLLIGIHGIAASTASSRLYSLFRKPSLIVAYISQGLFSATFLILFPTNCILLLLIWGLDGQLKLFSALASRSYFEIAAIYLPISFVLGTIEDSRSLCFMKADEEDCEKEESEDEPTQVKIVTNSNVDRSGSEEERVPKSVSEQSDEK